MRRTWQLVMCALTVSVQPFLGAQVPTGAAGQAPDVVLEGDVEVEVEDGTAGARVHHRLNVGSRRITLRFEDGAPSLVTGTRIRVRGRMQNDTLALSNTSSSVQTLIAVAPNTFGEQRTIVMLVNFQNNTSTPYSVASAEQVTFQTTSDFFRESSYGQTWLTGDVFGWLTIPMDAPASSCDYYKIATLAEEAAVGAGAKLADYTRRIIAFPQASGCGWWGVGNVGGNPSRAWVNGSYALKVVAHELGHNFGDWHSKSRSCDSGGCTTSEYGDSHDVMGNPSSGHMTAFQKERLGWLDYGSSPPIQTVSAAGAYWIDAYEPDGSGPKALRILKSVDSSGRRTWYYAEVRTPSGFDSDIASGVLLHTGSEASGDSSFQIDLAPATTTFDRILDPSQTFTDPDTGMSITTTSAGSAGAWVQVSYDGGVCATSAPTVALLPTANQTVALNQAADYVVRLTNKDSAGCASASFALSAAVPSGWNGTYGQSVVVVPPGAAAEVALTIVPADGATGTNAFSSLASRSGADAPGGSTAGAVTVISSLATTLQIAKSGAGYKFTVTVRAGSSPIAGASVAVVVTGPTGVIVPLSGTTNSSGVVSLTFKPGRKDPRGVYQVVATAGFAGMTGTASGSFTF